ncbi:protein of unknown function [Hyphomicrobium sp. MC1]|nr:protein of unknown function [Hyphomicrobium sp. MC1]
MLHASTDEAKNVARAGDLKKPDRRAEICGDELPRRLLLTGDRNSLALAGAGVRVRALTANGEALAVTKTAVATEVHQALDVGLNFAAEIAFDRVIAVDGFTDLQDLSVGQLIDAALRRDAALLTNLFREFGANAMNITQRDFNALACRNVDACDAGHFSLLPLNLVSN